MQKSGVRCVVPAGDRCGEGAVWSPELNAVFWVDINRFLLHRYDPETGATRSWFLDEPATALNLTEDPEMLVACFSSRIALWDCRRGAVARELWRLPTYPTMRCNDARVDPRGSLWMGTMPNNVGPDGEDLELEWRDGVLYRLDADGRVSEWRRNVGISNTLAWSPDGRTFYFADTPANTVYAWDYDASDGSIAGEREFLRGYKGIPDGSTMDEEGFLWNARPTAGMVARVAPDGRIDREIELPVRRPTTCIFGGRDLSTLYITSAAAGDRLDGGLFALEPGVRGLPANRFGVRG